MRHDNIIIYYNIYSTHGGGVSANGCRRAYDMQRGRWERYEILASMNIFFIPEPLLVYTYTPMVGWRSTVIVGAIVRA